MKRWIFSLVCFLSLGTGAALANPHQIRVPLKDGKLDTADLSAKVFDRLHLPGASTIQQWQGPAIDLNSWKGSLFLTALNRAMGEGCHAEVDADALLVSIDPDKLPKDFDQTKLAVRVFTENAAPVAAGNQNRFYGLHLPPHLNESGSLVILVHGLDSEPAHWDPMAKLLEADGYQVAYFIYPSDQPLTDSGALLAEHVAAVRETFPQLKLDVLAHSMGCLVARSYLEGDAYTGGVDHFIMIAPPNHGTKWATYRIALEAEEHYSLWQHEPNWSPSWMITDGLGEAGRDLKPDSKFLADLNAKPRRADVRYTIIAGSHNQGWRVAADRLTRATNLLPESVRNVWGFRQMQTKFKSFATRLSNLEENYDGPVTRDSTKLNGVDDWVLLPGDHTSLFCTPEGVEPVAWSTVRDRLGSDR